MKTVGSAMATLSVAVLIAGLIWPRLALTLLQALTVTLALAYVGARVYRSRLPAPLTTDSYSPFDRVAPDPPRSARLPAVRDLSTLLQAADDPNEASRAEIPSAACRIVYAEASRRLAEHHGLSAHRAADHDRIRALVSDATWSLLVPERIGARGSTAPDWVPMSLLDNVLDDVERL